MSGSESTTNTPERLYAFVDTNLLLQFQFFRDVDWPVVLGAREVVLVLALVVLSEVDRFKWSGTKRQRDRARAVHKAFDKLELSNQPVQLRAGVSIMAIADEPDQALFEGQRLQSDIPDDRLLATLMGFRAGLSTGDVVLVTDDTPLRVKARARNINVKAPDASLALPDEPDETERELAAAKRELAILKNAQPKLRATLDGESHHEFSVQLVNPLPEERMSASLAAWRKRYPRATATPETLDGPAGLSVSMKMFAGMSGFNYITEEEAVERNKTLDELFAAYQEYVRHWHAIVNRRRSTLRLPFDLENTGTAPADDVHVEFWTEAHGTWLKRPQKAPKPPAPLKARDPLDLTYRALMPNLDLPGMRSDPDLDGPDIVDENPSSVRYWARRVKHHVPCELPSVYFAFNTPKDVGSFTIHYRINAGNVHAPVEGTIGAKVETPEQADAPLPPSPDPIDEDADDADDEDGEDELQEEDGRRDR